MHKRIIRSLIKLFGSPTTATLINDCFLINWKSFNHCNISFAWDFLCKGQAKTHASSICNKVYLHNFFFLAVQV